MIRILLIAGLIFVSVSSWSQNFGMTPITDHAFCKPGVINKSPSQGVVVEYSMKPNTAFRTDHYGGVTNTGNVRSLERLKMKLKVPVLNKSGLKVLFGLNHYREVFHFDQIDPELEPLLGDFDGKVLKSGRISLYLLKALNRRNYLLFKGDANYNGDFKQLINFDKRYAVYRTAAMWGFKKRDDLEFGFGVLYSKGYSKTTIYPFAMYNQTFNQKWGIEFAVPVQFKLRYNHRPGSLVLFGAEYKGSDYSVDLLDMRTNLESLFHIKNSAIQFSLDYQKQLTSWTWLSMKAGYVHHLDSKFDQVSTDHLVKVTPSGGPIFSVGFFVSPPKKFLK